MRYNNILYLDCEETPYTRGIKDELWKISDNVDCYFYDGIYKPPIFLQRINPKDCQKQRDERIRLFLEHIKHNRYDLILVKAPFYLPTYFFENLKNIFKNVPIINYNWSSIRMFDFLPYRDFFTKIYSFDPNDCHIYNLNYYPLFYLKSFEKIGINKKKRYDMSFIGYAYSPGRLEFINKWLQKMLPQGMSYFLYLHTPKKRKAIFILLKYPRLSGYCFLDQISMNEVINIYSVSDAMIDHPMTLQSGLTIRTFETLGSGLNLYTTNLEIKNESFYDSKRITICDKELNNFDLRNKQRKNIDRGWQDSFSKYRIDNWVKQIITI